MKIKIHYFLILFVQLVLCSSTFAKQKNDTNQLKTDLTLLWPLAQTVKIEYDLVNAQLQFYKIESEKKIFLKKFELFVKDKYFKKVLELNLRQGKLLVLLISREIGKTPFELLKENIGFQRAIFWQRFAKILGANLREKYNPKEHYELETEIHNLLNKQSIPPVFYSGY